MTCKMQKQTILHRRQFLNIWSDPCLQNKKSWQCQSNAWTPFYCKTTYPHRRAISTAS